ncbi:MAG: YdcF family protein [Acidimicrobiia bacterium]
MFIRLLRAAVAVTMVAALYVMATVVQVWSASRADERVAVDAIVVLGAAQYDGRPSPVLAARLDHALELWQQGLAPLVVVTGGKQSADRFTEARASADYLIERGVPDAAILREVQGRTSWESLAAAARILRERDLRSVLLVSDPYHAKRIAAIATELGLSAHVSSTRTSPEGDGSVLKHFVQETAGVALGRFIGYRRLLRLDQ